MPEGDTIHRIARALSAELPGRVVDRLTLRDRGPVTDLEGREVEGVEARGKHLLIHISGGWSLHIHLGMNGRVTRRHVREAPPRSPTATLACGETVYSVERAFTAETVRTSGLRHHPKLARLGPDLLAGLASVDEAVRRARHPAQADRALGDLLLDQRVAAGIGNVFKSEVLFECRVHPTCRVRDLAPDRLRRLFVVAARQLAENMDTRRRTTVPLRRRPTPSSQRLWVYGRSGKPCMECGASVQRFLQGDMARSTYFCPTCQSPCPHAGGGDGTEAERSKSRRHV
jgi:endonuclease VIII